MKYKVIAADPLCGRMLALEAERAGLTPASDGSENYTLLLAEGQTELPSSRRMRAAVLIDCGILAASLPESVRLLILDRPFSLAELRSFVGRLLEEGDAGAEESGVVLIPDELTVCLGDHSAKLTKREYALFEYLYSRPYETITRAELLHNLWKDENARDTNIVDVYVKFLRTKLDERFGVRLLRSKRGEGYMYAPDDAVGRGRNESDAQQ